MERLDDRFGSSVAEVQAQPLTEGQLFDRPYQAAARRVLGEQVAARQRTVWAQQIEFPCQRLKALSLGNQSLDQRAIEALCRLIEPLAEIIHAMPWRCPVQSMCELPDLLARTLEALVHQLVQAMVESSEPAEECEAVVRRHQFGRC